MTTVRAIPLAIVTLMLNVAGCVSGGRPSGSDSFMPDEIRAAERAMITALESPDPTAWVYLYTEDAILLEPGEAPVQGREALLAMAGSMKPLSSVTIVPERTVGDGDLAYTYGRASWVNGRPPNAGSTTNVRVVMIWRKEADGVWRLACEVIAPDTQSKQAPPHSVVASRFAYENLARAAAFYDALLAEIGAKRLMDYGRGYAYGDAMGKPSLGIVTPYDGKPATVGNGVMVALGVDARATVDRVYRKALELGGTDEGPAGPRGDDFYAGYFRDLDGNKLSVFCLG